VSGVFAALVSLLFIVKQLLVDTAAMLTLNITAVLGTTIVLLGQVAGMLYDIERILEKVIDLLVS